MEQRFLNYFMAAVMLSHLLTCISAEGYRDRSGKAFAWMLALDICLLIAEAEMVALISAADSGGNAAALWFTNCIIQVCYYALLAVTNQYFKVLIEYMSGKKIKPSRWSYYVCAISALLWCISPWTGMFVRFGPEGMVRGPLYVFGQLGGWIVGLGIVYRILRHSGQIGAKNTLALLSFPVLPLLASVVRLFRPDFSLSFFGLFISFSFLVLYDYVFWTRTHLVDLQSRQLAEDRAAFMSSQINRHFTYNVLNSIYYLCEKDPAQARKAISEFSDYLRGKMDGIQRNNLITATQEIENVRHYLALEKMRFGEDLRVEADLETVDFMIPSLSLQPLVENAVRHGVMQREEGGTVRLSSERTDGYIIVKVEDDGVGFDPEEVLNDDRVHIGIQNVRWRLWSMCRAEMKVESQPGTGTTVTIMIPEQDEEEETKE